MDRRIQSCWCYHIYLTNHKNIPYLSHIYTPSVASIPTEHLWLVLPIWRFKLVAETNARCQDIGYQASLPYGRNTSLLERRRYVRNSSTTILRSSILPFTRIRHPCCSADPISCSPPSSLQHPVVGLALSDWSRFEPHPRPLHQYRLPQLSLLPSSLQPL